MRTRTLSLGLVLLFARAAFPACDQKCETGPSIFNQCDIECGSNQSTCGGGTFAACDQCPPGNPDGKCVICGKDNSATITGTGGVDTVCMAGGDDVVDAKGGDDTILIGRIFLGATPLTSGTGGNKKIDAGAGADLLIGGTGDDVIFGGNGDDLISGCGGRDILNGGADDDAINSAGQGGIACTAADDVVGSVLCGGAGNDTLTGKGPAHQCIDGGTGSNSCSYVFSVSPSRTATDFDLGTFNNCGAVGPPCGCDTLPF